MASHSPQRIRKPQAHPPTPGSIHLQTREMSPSPTHKPRPMKTMSMPIVPTVMQIFGNGGQQGSPTATHNLNALQRSPPNTRLLPSPPQSSAHEPEREMTPPHPHNPNVNYPRPMAHLPLPDFLHKLDGNWQMTEELMAEIERADLQQSQSNVHYSPPRVDPAVERVRVGERSSPKNLDGQHQRRQPLRESPKARQPISPTTSSIAQVPRASEAPAQNLGDGYNPYQNQDHGSPSQVQSTRRTSAPVLLAIGTHGQTPPLQAMAVNPRTPDRSLPVQEEQEDEVPHDSHHYAEGRDPERSSSPTPSSDLNPEGIARYEANILSHGGRHSRAGHRQDDDDDDTLLDPDLDETMRARGTRTDDEGSHTPRSAQFSLSPDHAMEPDRYRYAFSNATIRVRTRNGSTDQLGLQNLDPAMFADKVGPASPDPDGPPPPQYAEPRRDARDVQEYPPQLRHYDSRAPSNGQPVYTQHMHADEFQHYMDHPTMQSYFNSPRPNAPIPPTPHSQTAAPSPSPLVHGAYDDQNKEYPPYSPVVPAGSPYPYPFNHVRRNHSYPYASRQASSANYDPNHPTSIQEQLARQWQVYAQNQTALAGGHVSDSTFSPASTPYPGGAAFNPWAYLHANRALGGGSGGVGRPDLRSLQSSPSHEPVALPIPPSIGIRKRDRDRPGPIRQLSARKPPPRVDSTQPRSTPEPEPESSGESTAGEPEDTQRFAVPEEGSWVGVPVSDPVAAADADWVDEEDEGDGEDLLELEYHPTYVSNVEKRRRRWETRWDSLIQAFNALDRQTDATLVLLAAPSHTTKLHALTSRSIKRHPSLAQSPAMKDIRVGFHHIAARRRATRSHQSSLADRIMSSSSGEGSNASAREEDLKRALGTALGSLNALRGIYEQREARWSEEMRRVSDDRERVELLLRQVLGEDHAGGRAL
ncbi:hypothetical protein GGX14DRAFT_671522 [Mycena pura]|uniref:Uncharacterized protein n=1 Tax=Mycena pura TaxID=153505 RepID=A0AAD6UXP6_9AGAR|nr:hypothetical protein GGX14DRAFT_671522 [Mycena pura]